MALPEFKTQLNGYAKKEVLDYVEQQQAAALQEQTKLQEELKKLSVQAVGLNVQVDEQNARISELQQQLAGRK